MPILYDARGNEIRSHFPDSVTNETVTDARPITAVLGALNAEAVMDLNGVSTVNFDVRTAAGALTFVFEGTIDGVNYFALPAYTQFQLLAGVAIAEQFVSAVVVATTQSGVYSVNCSSLRRVRLRISAYASGNITVASRGSAAPILIVGRPLPALFHVTATAAANTAATATLPAAGAGLFHYITSIQIYRNATAALAGTATLIHTSTNLPGNPAWSVGNAMVAGGTQADLVYEPANPLKSSVANTNTTIVAAAAGAAVLNRVNVSYYVGQ